MVFDGAMERFGLCALEPPIPLNSARFSKVWSFRLANDPGSHWLRGVVMNAFADIQKAVAANTSSLERIKVRSRTR